MIWAALARFRVFVLYDHARTILDSSEVVIRDGKTKEEREGWKNVDLLDRTMWDGSFRE
jgi:hypothetical protein